MHIENNEVTESNDSFGTRNLGARSMGSVLWPRRPPLFQSHSRSFFPSLSLLLALLSLAGFLSTASAQYRDIEVEIPASPVDVVSPVDRATGYLPSGILDLARFSVAQPPVITALATTTTESGAVLVVAAGDDHLVRLWDVSKGRVIHTFRGHTDWVRCAQFTRDGLTLITAGTDGRVMVWDAKKGEKIGQRYRSEHSINAMRLTADEKRLLLVGFDAPMKVIEFASGKRLSTAICPCQDMRAVAISEDGRLAAAAGRNGKIWVWSIRESDNSKLLKELTGHRQRVRALAFVPYSQHLISAGDDRKIRIWDVETGESIKQISAGPARVMSMLAPRTGPIATGGSDNIVRLWDRETGASIAQLTGHTGSVVALSSNGGSLFSAGYDTTVRIWKLDNGTIESARTVRATIQDAIEGNSAR